MKKIYGNMLEMIGNTPLVEIRRLNTCSRVKIYAKLESFNPGGSIKARPALYMLEKAEERGLLTKEKIILEATSGNTGIGLALVAAAKEYRIMLAMSESASEERKKILRSMGVELFLTPANLGTDGAIEVVYEMLRKHPEKYYVPDQYNNEDNVMAHYYGTGEEIWQQTDGRVSMVVATLGTTGTAMGIARRLKEYDEKIKIIGVEPYLRHKIQGLKNMKESYKPGIFNKSLLDEKVNILDEEAFETARNLARKEGIFVGMSSGAAMAIALEKAKEMDEGIIVVICPDGGERYLSTELFDDKSKSSLQVYNTLSRKKEFFEPIQPSKVLIHSCGPAVHDIPHVGTFRRFVFSDMIMRYFEFKGYTVKLVSNIIDLSDNAIKKSEHAQKNVRDFTSRYADVFMKDIKQLNVSETIIYPKASEQVDAMLELAEKLVNKGYAYEKLRSVYFDISRLDDYGVLSNINLAKVRQTEAIVEQDDYQKDNPVDFTLLKRSTLSELKRGIFFKTQWGNVRPSWHLECAAISMKCIADSFDIHISGTDIIFPHCENVMAIGKAATGKNLANYWMNTELIMIDGKKMSRSLDNILTVKDIESRGYTGKEIRYFLLSSHYRKPLNFSFGALDTARNTVRKLNDFIQRLYRLIPGEGYEEIDQLIYDLNNGFVEAMDDDFNISNALAVLFEFVRKINVPLVKRRINDREKEKIIDVMKKIDSVLGVIDFEEETLGDYARKLMAARQEARQRKHWEEADRIRDELAEMGVFVYDTPEGSSWKLQ